MQQHLLCVLHQEQGKIFLSQERKAEAKLAYENSIHDALNIAEDGSYYRQSNLAASYYILAGLQKDEHQYDQACKSYAESAKYHEEMRLQGQAGLKTVLSEWLILRKQMHNDAESIKIEERLKNVGPG